ncbi:MAG: tRNA glutamyl-Q(34) synthetase GluQRS [Sedimenticolaceae bacterium]
MNPAAYRGRFAPSPTGPMHFGSLVAAVASYADARHQNGEWLVRIEDVDETRRHADAERSILRTLQTFGMQWDGPTVRQSERGALYDQVIAILVERRLAYRCSCSRRLIASTARLGSEGPIYPGTCRENPPGPEIAAAWRMIVGSDELAFDDRIVGEVVQDLASEIGDFIIRRRDGFTAYQLAVVVDDYLQGITHVVRGADLLWSTPRQLWLQRQLGYATPSYAHIPLVYAADGHKLSKSDGVHPVRAHDPVRSLREAWHHLGQPQAPNGLNNPADFWAWAIPHWRIDKVPLDRNSTHERPDSL